MGFDRSSFLPASPKVRLSLLNAAPPATLICNVAGYYPLDVSVTWTREEQGGSPAPVSGASLSNLRRSPAGTYSISSSLTVEPSSVGATYTCQVTHVSLEEPLGAHAWVAPPGMGVPSFPHLYTWAQGSCPLAGLVLLPRVSAAAFPRWGPSEVRPQVPRIFYYPLGPGVPGTAGSWRPGLSSPSSCPRGAGGTD